MPGTAIVTWAQLTPVGMPLRGVKPAALLDGVGVGVSEEDAGLDDGGLDCSLVVEPAVDGPELLEPAAPVLAVAVPIVGLPAAAVERHGLVTSRVPIRIAATATMAPISISDRRRRPDSECSNPA
jgi:hypothetical protein